MSRKLRVSSPKVGSAEQVIASNRDKGDGLSFYPESLCLNWQATDRSPIFCTVDQAAWANKREEVLTAKFREEAIIVLHKQLSGVEPELVVMAAVEY